MVTWGIRGMNQNQLIENMRKLIDELLENISHLKSENNRLKTENSYLKNKIEKTKAGIEEYAKKQIEKELAKIIKELNDEKALNAAQWHELKRKSLNVHACFFSFFKGVFCVILAIFLYESSKGNICVSSLFYIIKML